MTEGVTKTWDKLMLQVIITLEPLTNYQVLCSPGISSPPWGRSVIKRTASALDLRESPATLPVLLVHQIADCQKQALQKPLP